MDLRELARYRLQIGAAAAIIVLLVWVIGPLRSRRGSLAALSVREQSLIAERDRLGHEIEQERRQLEKAKALPARVAPALASAMSPVDRLNYFLENITRPANDLDLGYFTVTPLAPVAGPNTQELPFSISVAGSYVALADYLYQLEYGRDFVVRDLSMRVEGPPEKSVVRADFQLSALLLNDPLPQPAATEPQKDPGPPTSLELARNPFVRSPAKLATRPDGKSYFLNVPPGLQLTGVMNTSGRMVAIINHEPYGVGDTIDNKTITKIDERGVEMTDKVRSYFLEMERPRYSATAAREEASRR